MYSSLKGLGLRHLQGKAQEYSMEHPNATWKDVSSRIIPKDVSFQVSSNFLNDEEQNKVESFIHCSLDEKSPS